MQGLSRSSACGDRVLILVLVHVLVFRAARGDQQKGAEDNKQNAQQQADQREDDLDQGNLGVRR